MDYTKYIPKSKGVDYSKYAPKGISLKPDLKTSQGLYNLAVQSGLEKDANRIMASQQGEETRKIFSGGFISDIFDVLNALQYGVVGTLKGKGFAEGVKTRQSFSDKDALGDNGLPGVIAGIALDIAVDPLTYIAPATILKKIPGLTKLASAVKGLAFGKKVERTIETAEGLKKFMDVEGGTKLGKWLSQKFVWMSGADPIFKESYERSIKNIAQGTTNVADMAKGVAQLSPDVSKKILTKKFFPELKGERFIRTPLKELQKILKPDEFENVKTFYNKLDALGKEASDLGLISKGKFEENIGEYIKNAYLEYEQKGTKSLFGRIKTGIKGIKGRKEVSAEKLAELGQIDNPAFLLFKSTFDLIKDVENAKLFNAVNKNFASDIMQEGFKQIPRSQRFATTAGLQADTMLKIKDINKNLKPALANLKQTFKADRKVLTEINNLEKTMSKISNMRAEELTEFFMAGRKGLKEVPKWRRLGTLPDNLVGIGQQVKKFNNFDDFIKSDVGIKVEKLFIDGVLERNGFSNIENFFKYVKKPFIDKPSKIVETISGEDIPKIIKLQKQFESLSQKSNKLREIDKKSIDDSYRFLEETIYGLTTKKEELVEQLQKIKFGNLEGKYIPENMFDYIQEISDPVNYNLGKKLVADFKFFKVVMNPATHARNVVSNQILNFWKLGMNPLDPRTIKANTTALGEIAKKGGKFIDEAKQVGYGIDTFASNEIYHLLDSPEVLGFSKKLGSYWGNFKQKMGSIYQGEENFAKLSAFIFNRNKGIDIEEAWKLAESATFNYAQVTPFVRKLRTSLFGFPFITFTMKATPLAVETALKAPQRISSNGKIKQAIETQSDLQITEREKQSEPPWIKDGFYVKLPMKDKHGRSAYFDLTYIIPFGDLVAGNFFERQTMRETGTKEGLPSAIASKSPFFNFVKEISRNQDFYGNKIWKDSDNLEKQTADLFRHFTKTYLPPLVADQIPGGYNDRGERQQRGFIGSVQTPADEQNQKRTLMQEMLRNVGAKIQPIDVDIQETYQEWNKKKALETLLREKGILSQFDVSYLKK